MPAKRQATSSSQRVDGVPVRGKSQRISTAGAAALTKRFRKAAPSAEHAGFFYAEGIKAVLSQRDVSGIRIYHGLDEKGSYRMVIVGVDSRGRDITGGTRAGAKAAKSGDAVLLDWHLPCPPFCTAGSPL